MSREKHQSYYCCEDGCDESVMYGYSNRKELIDMDKRHRGKWKCSKHEHPEEWLSLSNLKTVKVMTSGKSKLGGLYWGNFRGLTHGDGYRASADEFPEGTLLKVTAEIILPEPNLGSGN